MTLLCGRDPNFASGSPAACSNEGDEGRAARSRGAGPRGGRERERTSASPGMTCRASLQTASAGCRPVNAICMIVLQTAYVFMSGAFMSKLDRVESPACWSVRHIPRHRDHGTRKHAAKRRKLLERSAAERLLLSLSIGKAPATRPSRANLLARGESERNPEAGGAAETHAAAHPSEPRDHGVSRKGSH